MRALHPQVAPLSGDFGGCVAAVEKTNGQAAIGQRLRPDFHRAILRYTNALLAKLVLIHRDHFLVHQDIGDRGLHVADVVAGQQRRGQQAPQAHVGLVFDVGHAAVADLQHVGVVPVADAGVLLAAGLELEADVVHGLPTVVDVAGGAPQIAADFVAPLANIQVAVLAKAVDNGAAGVRQRIPHLGVGGGHGGLAVVVNLRGAAPVVLQIVDAPGGVSLGILLFVLVAAFVIGAGPRAG